MEITIVRQENRQYFEPLMPSQMWAWTDFVLGAIVDETACGILAVQESGRLLEILYLYVAEPFRRKGVATELLNALHEVGQLSQMDGEVCQYILGEETKELEECLCQNLFQSDEINSRIYEIKPEDLSEKYFKRPCEGRGRKLTPLSKVTARMWNQFLDRINALPDGDGNVPHLDSMYLYDQEISFLLTRRGEAIGCALFEKTDDRYIFSYFCVLEESSPMEMMGMLKASYEVLKEKCRKTDRIYVNALTETVEKMVFQLTEGKASAKGQAVSRHYVY